MYIRFVMYYIYGHVHANDAIPTYRIYCLYDEADSGVETVVVVEEHD